MYPENGTIPDISSIVKPKMNTISATMNIILVFAFILNPPDAFPYVTNKSNISPIRMSSVITVIRRDECYTALEVIQ